MLRWLTAGESHGAALVAILEGLPAGVEVTTAEVVRDLARRRLGYGRGARMGFEQDEVAILGGLRHGKTLGSPLALQVGNTEWPRWREAMAPDPVDPSLLANLARSAPLTRPRPGHADLAGLQKYGFGEVRPVLERASARETAARVALAACARAFLHQAAGVEVVSHVVAVGGVEARPAGGERLHQATIDADPLRCADPEASARMRQEIDAARADGDTVGGVIEVLAYRVPPGLGSYVQGDRRLDTRLAAALVSIPAVKGVEIGDAAGQAGSRGSAAHDEIGPNLRRVTNRAGGVEGGVSNGETVWARAMMKPLSSLARPLATVDIATGEPAVSITQRSDVCAVPAAGVVAEAMVVLVLAQALLEKAGGDSLHEVQRNLSAWSEA